MPPYHVEVQPHPWRSIGLPGLKSQPDDINDQLVKVGFERRGQVSKQCLTALQIESGGRTFKVDAIAVCGASPMFLLHMIISVELMIEEKLLT